LLCGDRETAAASARIEPRPPQVFAEPPALMFTRSFGECAFYTAPALRSQLQNALALVDADSARLASSTRSQRSTRSC